MARKINEKLIKRLVDGDLVPFLNYVKSESGRLRLEVRQEGKAFVYYKKCKALELGVRSYNIDKKYFDNNQKPQDIEAKILYKPDVYFEETISAIDKWLIVHNKGEFATQQNIATENDENNNRYLILDMEYNFSQSGIAEDKRLKRAGFDLLGIDKDTGAVVFFEVKKGLKALRGKAGIGSHIADFENYMLGLLKDVFRKDLINDITNILRDKTRLGLLKSHNILKKISEDNIELVFVFEPENCDEGDYNKVYKEECDKSGSKRNYKTIFVSKGNYKLI